MSDQVRNDSDKLWLVPDAELPEYFDNFLLVKVLDRLPRVGELGEAEESLVDFVYRVALLDDAQKVLCFLLDAA